jgi:ketosteroid isomerase-like protein
MRVMRKVLVLSLLLVACTSRPVRIDEGSGAGPDDPTLHEIQLMLDAWHDAAGDADEERYFRAMAPEFVFLGTDAGERWTLEEFRAFAHPYFAKGSAWRFTPTQRHVILSPAGDVAWFDERLDSATYGECRGSGVVRRENGRWLIAHFNLTIPIPNDLAKTVVGMIREQKPSTQ